MTYNFADSFDLYATTADAILGYWDSGSGTPPLVAGRFTGSRAISFAGTNNVVKSSGQNDAVHHFAVSYLQTLTVGGTTVGNYITIYDGATAQCSVTFRSDGQLDFRSGGPTGTILDSWAGAFTINNTWYAFEFEIVVDGSAGSWAVRRGGNNVNDHFLGSLNTKVSANAYGNKVQIGCNTTVTGAAFDDFYWRSGSATGSWLGDIRCYTRMPASDQSVQFSRLTPYNLLIATLTGSLVHSAGRAYYPGFTSAVNGVINSLNLPMIVGFTGNIKCAIFADNGAGFAGVVVGSPATILNNPVTGNNTITFPTPVPITARTKYYVGVIPDTTGGTFQSDNVGNDSGYGTGVSYASFPANNPASGGVTSALSITVNITPSDNYSEVAEAQQNAAFSYVYDSNPGDADFYGITPIGVTPASVIATVTRALMMKSDTGSRTAAVQLKSGSTTVVGNTVTLTNSGWQWSWRVDVNDPSTSAAWTATGVTNAQIGPTVIA